MLSKILSTMANFVKLSRRLFESKETPYTWRKINQDIQDVEGICSKKLFEHPSFTARVGEMVSSLARYISADHITLSVSVLSLSACMLAGVEKEITGFVEAILPATVQNLRSTNQTLRDKSFDLLSLVIKKSRNPCTVPHIIKASLSRSTIARPYGLKLLNELLEIFPEQLIYDNFWEIEEALLKALGNPSVAERELNHSSIMFYIRKLPVRKYEVISLIPESEFDSLERAGSKPKGSISSYILSFGERHIPRAKRVLKPVSTNVQNPHVVFKPKDNKNPEFSQAKSKTDTGLSNTNVQKLYPQSPSFSKSHTHMYKKSYPNVSPAKCLDAPKPLRSSEKTNLVRSLKRPIVPSSEEKSTKLQKLTHL